MGPKHCWENTLPRPIQAICEEDHAPGGKPTFSGAAADSKGDNDRSAALQRDAAGRDQMANSGSDALTC
jgi:hypothetical protein